MSDKTAVQCFEEVLENTVRSKMKRVQAKREIEKAIKDLSFLHERLMLEDNDPSYEFRYGHALAFWKEVSGEQMIDNSKVDKLVKDLKEELRQKENFYIRDAEEHSDHSDGSLKVDKKYPGMKGWEEKQVVGYVTTISKGKIFVKPIECERELEVVKQEIPISCDLTNPGDEVEVAVCAKQKRFGRNLSILKYVCHACTQY